MLLYVLCPVVAGGVLGNRDAGLIVAAHVFNDSTGLFTVLHFYNSETKTTCDEDPRLGPLPEEWEAVYRGERTSEDPRIFRCFRNKQTRKIVNSDPRMEPEVLGREGVGLRIFALV
jgi:hypothetical protein